MIPPTTERHSVPTSVSPEARGGVLGRVWIGRVWIAAVRRDSAEMWRREAKMATTTRARWESKAGGAAYWMEAMNEPQGKRRTTHSRSGAASRLVQVCDTRGKNRAGRLGNRLCVLRPASGHAHAASARRSSFVGEKILDRPPRAELIRYEEQGQSQPLTRLVSIVE